MQREDDDPRPDPNEGINIGRSAVVGSSIYGRTRKLVGGPGGVRRAAAPTGPRRADDASHSLLMTRLGPLDCLGAIEGGRDYDALVPLSVEIELELEGHPLRVLGLETIVAIKRESTAEGSTGSSDSRGDFEEALTARRAARNLSVVEAPSTLFCN